MMARRCLIAACALPLLGAAPTRPRVLTEEPLNGTLRPAETVLVDDGSCPTGQIKRITAQTSRRRGTVRQVTCIIHPR